MNFNTYPKPVSKKKLSKMFKTSLSVIDESPKQKQKKFVVKNKSKKNKKKQNSIEKIPEVLEKNFSKHLDKFLKGYSQRPVKRYEKLSNAMKNALESNTTTGITMSKKMKKYTLRKGKDLLNSPSGEVSWFKVPSKSNSAKSNSAKSNSAKSNSAKSNSAKSNSAKSNSAKSNSSKKIKKGPKYVRACYRKCQVKCNAKYGN